MRLRRHFGRSFEGQDVEPSVSPLGEASDVDFLSDPEQRPKFWGDPVISHTAYKPGHEHLPLRAAGISLALDRGPVPIEEDGLLGDALESEHIGSPRAMLVGGAEQRDASGDAQDHGLEGGNSLPGTMMHDARRGNEVKRGRTFGRREFKKRLKSKYERLLACPEAVADEPDAGVAEPVERPSRHESRGPAGETFGGKTLEGTQEVLGRLDGFSEEAKLESQRPLGTEIGIARDGRTKDERPGRITVACVLGVVTTRLEEANVGALLSRGTEVFAGTLGIADSATENRPESSTQSIAAPLERKMQRRLRPQLTEQPGNTKWRNGVERGHRDPHCSA